MATRNFKLTPDAKKYIVRQLALGELRHDDIVDQVREQFDISIHKRAIAHYTPHNQRLDEELKALYEETHARKWDAIYAEIEREREEQRQKRERDEEEERERMRRKFGL